MHLHWKHRELVKIIYKARNKIDLEQTAKMLEYESGGILIGTVPTSKGQAILVYRGKNYSRPPELRPRSLLTKRQALKRSIELQRQEVCSPTCYSLLHFYWIRTAFFSRGVFLHLEDSHSHHVCR